MVVKVKQQHEKPAAAVTSAVAFRGVWHWPALAPVAAFAPFMREQDTLRVYCAVTSTLLAVVCEDGEVVGVVSQRDIVLSGVSWALGLGRSAEEKALETCREDARCNKFLQDYNLEKDLALGKLQRCRVSMKSFPFYIVSILGKLDKTQYY